MDNEKFNLGHGTRQITGRPPYPFNVWLHFDKPHSPIEISEGIGHAANGGYFSLQELIKPHWDDCLTICRCLWLRDLASEEQKRGKKFTPSEIHGRFGKQE